MGNELAVYGASIKEIKELVYRRQYEAMKRVNSSLYISIGKSAGK